MPSTVTVATKQASSSYGISICSGALSSVGQWAGERLTNGSGRIAVVSNRKVAGLYGETVVRGLSAAGFRPELFLIGDGERFKSLRTLENTLQFLSSAKLTRTDALVALGGGVVGDLGGFAASIYLRGIEFLQIPTTLLSMIDSSVGGKTGINSSFGKNLIGAFYQPRGVLIDPETLRTLPKRELTAGFCEAVKQGAISGRKLLDATAAVLDRIGTRKLSWSLDDEKLRSSLEKMLAAQVSFKARIVAGDVKESALRTDPRSRKILNFGHTLGHALEKVTNYRYFKHGEAVGHGIRFAAELSKNLGLLAQDEVKLLNDVVRRAGELPPMTDIDPREVFATFKFDKKLINNSLNWVLLKKIGEPVIVPHSNISQSMLSMAFKDIARG